MEFQNRLAEVCPSKKTFTLPSVAVVPYNNSVMRVNRSISEVEKKPIMATGIVKPRRLSNVELSAISKARLKANTCEVSPRLQKRRLSDFAEIDAKQNRRKSLALELPKDSRKRQSLADEKYQTLEVFKLNTWKVSGKDSGLRKRAAISDAENRNFFSRFGWTNLKWNGLENIMLGILIMYLVYYNMTILRENAELQIIMVLQKEQNWWKRTVYRILDKIGPLDLITFFGVFIIMKPCLRGLDILGKKLEHWYRLQEEEQRSNSNLKMKEAKLRSKNEIWKTVTDGFTKVVSTVVKAFVPTAAAEEIIVKVLDIADKKSKERSDRKAEKKAKRETDNMDTSSIGNNSNVNLATPVKVTISPPLTPTTTATTSEFSPTAKTQAYNSGSVNSYNNRRRILKRKSLEGESGNNGRPQFKL